MAEKSRWVKPAFQWLNHRLLGLEHGEDLEFRLRWWLLLSGEQRYLLSSFCEWQGEERGSDGSWVNATAQTLSSQEIPMTTKQVEREREDALAKLGYTWAMDERAQSVAQQARRDYQQLLKGCVRLARGGAASERLAGIDREIERAAAQCETHREAVPACDRLVTYLRSLLHEGADFAPEALERFVSDIRTIMDDAATAHELMHEQSERAVGAERARAELAEKVAQLELQLGECGVGDADVGQYENSLVRFLRSQQVQLQEQLPDLEGLQEQERNQLATFESERQHKIADRTRREAGRQEFRDRLVQLLQAGQDESEDYILTNNELAVVNSLIAELNKDIEKTETEIQKISDQITERQAAIDCLTTTTQSVDRFVAFLEEVLTQDLFAGKIEAWAATAAAALARIAPKAEVAAIRTAATEQASLEKLPGWDELPAAIRDFLETHRQLLDDSRLYLLQTVEKKREGTGKRWAEGGFIEKLQGIHVTILIVLVSLIRVRNGKYQDIVSRLLRPAFPGKEMIAGRIAWAFNESLKNLRITDATGIGLPQLEAIVQHLQSI